VSATNDKNNFALVRKPSGAVEKVAPGARRILSGIVADTLALTKRKPRIIAVDDEKDWLLDTFIEPLIRKWFKEVTFLSFSEGEKAWQELLCEDPDFLITDMVRRGMSGYEMLPLLAERKVKYPILVMSGYVEEKLVRHHAGQDLNILFLKKPFTSEQLHSELSKHFNSRLLRKL
jgi:DNA-binding NtrC family response regulator